MVRRGVRIAPRTRPPRFAVRLSKIGGRHVYKPVPADPWTASNLLSTFKSTTTTTMGKHFTVGEYLLERLVQIGVKVR